MRYSKLFGKTRHNPPCDADSVNAALLTQAGFIEKLSAGIYSFLPLGKRVLDKVSCIIKEEMNVVGGQEILMPALQPIDVWKTTGRDKTMDDVLYRTFASGNKEFVLGPSHEEVVTPLLAKYVQSYKDLPLSVYQLQSKFRDEPRAKSGLLRGREFGMKDMYSFHVSEEDLDDYYEKVTTAYMNIFDRCALKVHLIEASGGAFTDKYSHEFSVETPAGEDTIIVCGKCETAQNLEIAEGKIVEPGSVVEDELELEEVDIERGFSVAENAKAHGVADSKILKTVVYELEDGGLLGVLIRGDLNVSNVKLENYLKKKLRPASAELLKEAGLVRGYISPVALQSDVKLSFIADHSIKNVKNFVTGANQYAKDFKNVNLARDFVVSDFTDLAEVNSSFSCVKCESPLTEMKVVEAANIFKLGTKFSKDFGLSFTDSDGSSKPVVMGCYGIGVTRLIGTIVEASHDENGMIWPLSVAPYQIYLVRISKDDELNAKADELYESLLAHGYEVLYDDRDVGPGVKFKDADLIGLPLRLVISNRTVENNSVEFKWRTSKDAEFIEIDGLMNHLSEHLK